MRARIYPCASATLTRNSMEALTGDLCQRFPSRRIVNAVCLLGRQRPAGELFHGMDYRQNMKRVFLQLHLAQERNSKRCFVDPLLAKMFDKDALKSLTVR